MSVKIETPPVLSGATEAQLKQVYAYLYRLSENLNVAMNDLARGGTATQSQIKNGAAHGSSSDSVDRQQAESYKALRSLIINTAEIIRSEMDVIEHKLSSKYEAMSNQWGTFQENFQTTVTETAKEVVKQYNYDASIEALREQAAGFSEYQIKTEGSIRQGFIDEDENGVPILGIAIGQGLTSVKVTIDGEEYEKIDASQSCAFYTANKVSFRINGQEVAYLSNRKLYIGDMEVTGSVTLNGWQLTTNNGFVIKWIGGGN